MTSSDIIVVGGGTVGLATAWTLARMGVRVRVFDTHTPGWGASGRNQGFLGVQSRKSGTELELAFLGRQLVEENSLQLQSFGFRPCGGLTCFDTPRDMEFASSFVSHRQRDGLPMTVLTAKETLEKCPILREDIAGAIWNPLDGHQVTGDLCHALAKSLGDYGADLHFNTPVEELVFAGGRCVGVRSGTTTHFAETIVLAAGAWTQTLIAPLQLPSLFVSLRLQAALTAPVGGRIEPIVYGPSAAAIYSPFQFDPSIDNQNFAHADQTRYPELMLLECLAQRRDGRILLGCPLDTPDLLDTPTTAGAAWMLSAASTRFPALRNTEIERIWAGVAPMTRDFLPIISAVPSTEGLILNTGHVFGNLSSFPSALVVAGLLGFSQSPLDATAFRVDRLLSPGTTTI